MDPVVFLGQFIIGASFVLASVSDFFDRKPLLGLMKAKNIPLPGISMYLGILLKFVTGVAIALDYQAKIAAFILAIFIVIANFIFHNFWAYKNGQAKKEYLAFLAHVVIIGGLLMVIGT